MEHFDMVVVGAGWYGLAAAKTYIELHPDESVLVIEAAPTVGGVWAAHRLYPGLKSNNMLGTYEYSDFPMDEGTFGVKPGQHIPAAVVHDYLTKYAQHFDFFGNIRFKTKVQSAQPGESGGWLLKVTREEQASNVLTKRLIVATGLTTEPYMPTISGSGAFGGLIFHTSEFQSHEETLSTSKDVTVLGGAKSAWDAAYAYASAGVSVNMIIRKSGHGPVWMAPPYVTPLKKWLEKLVHTRFLTFFSPCIWGCEDGYFRIRSFLHGTWIGQTIVDTFWKILGKDVVYANGYDANPQVQKLKPRNSAFWIGSGLSILNYDTDFFELVKDGMIKVYVADVTHLSDHAVHLSSGETLPSDLILCATGWKARPPVDFIGSTSNERLSLPYYSPEPSDLVKRADVEILSRFPRLRQQPTIPHVSLDKLDFANQPFRLYRFMVPPSHAADRSIAFAGMLSTISTSICAQTQGLWISTFFDDQLNRLHTSLEALQWEATLHSQFGKWRYPCGYGARLPDFVFDAMPYVDMLMADLGLARHRKSSGLREVFEAYGPGDYKGLVGEWKAVHKDAGHGSEVE